MPIDISGMSYFMPLIGFLFVFLIVYAVLLKTKLLGENNWLNGIIAGIIAIVFATLSSAQEYVQTVTPWFAVLLIAIFFMILIVALSQKDVSEFMKPKIVGVFIAILILVFLFSAIKVFPNVMGDAWETVSGFVTNEARIAGAVILLIIAFLTAWIVTKK